MTGACVSGCRSYIVCCSQQQGSFVCYVAEMLASMVHSAHQSGGASALFRWPTEVKPDMQLADIQQCSEIVNVASIMTTIIKCGSAQLPQGVHIEHSNGDCNTTAWTTPSQKAWDILTATSFRALLLLECMVLMQQHFTPARNPLAALLHHPGYKRRCSRY